MEILLKSKRVKFDLFTKNKVNKDYKKWMNDKSITKYILKKHHVTIKQLKSFVESVDNSENYFFRIIEIKSNKHIGNVRVGPLNFKDKSSGFGIMIGNKKFHNKGYAKEVLDLSVDFLFYFLRFKKIKFDCFIDNTPAMKVYENLGFKKKVKNNKMVSFSKINKKYS